MDSPNTRIRRGFKAFVDPLAGLLGSDALNYRQQQIVHTRRQVGIHARQQRDPNS
jgi:hypothetical protein